MQIVILVIIYCNVIGLWTIEPGYNHLSDQISTDYRKLDK